jgi:hypothetical protein
VNVNVRFADEDVWLTREHLAEIYATTPQNISLHVGNIYQDKELNEEATRKKFFLVRQEGERQVKREIDHYNLDMIIALGYCVQSPIAVRFRRWATQRLHEYIQKGFTMDYERLSISKTTQEDKFHATYENAMQAINALREKFGGSTLFGNEKDDSFKSSIGQIYQTFGGEELYLS